MYHSHQVYMQPLLFLCHYDDFYYEPINFYMSRNLFYSLHNYTIKLPLVIIYQYLYFYILITYLRYTYLYQIIVSVMR